MSSLLRTPGEHKHPATDKFVISRDEIRAACKRRATEEINKKPARLSATKDTHIKILQHLSALSDISGFNVALEAAMHAAIKLVLPHVNNRACLFHVAQSWFRKIQALGWSKESRIRDWKVAQNLLCTPFSG
ncbi:nuclear hormone receptor family member nhr-59 [Plakobranchus ocellatus]|uniref:Nuclear hormone receptor family member nhr-59 n=1 Tax=Plakobranchus ocellatus TaxID=259542 RepID=A0AAV4CH90_9GAST|nr:nuclear hormone receptor family member nhr-59 [Plakobranchus ocellatus]